MPAGYALRPGRGVELRSGADVALIGYGPMLLTQAWTAADDLAADGIAAAVIDLPWLNRIDDEWVREALRRFGAVVTLDNQYISMGQGTMLAAALARTGVTARVLSLGLTDVPACGANAEVLAHHGLDGASLAQAVRTHLARV